MKTASVSFQESAIEDLEAIYEHIADDNGKARANRYVERITAHCMKLSLFPNRGRSSDELSPGLRILPFEGRVVIAYRIDDIGVRIVRVFYAGRDYAAEEFPD